MISLTKTQNMVVDLYPDSISFISNDLILTEWINKGVISGIESEAEAALYPDIIVIEIITALNLKKEYDYSLRKIAEARKYLNLDKENMAESEKNNILNFINLKKIYNDKKIVIKKTFHKINSIETMKNMINELYQENNKLKIIADYSFEFFQASRKVKKTKPQFIN